MNGIDLFNRNLLDSVRNQLKSAGLIFRPLNSQDYNKGFLQLLSQLTEVGQISQDQFLDRFHSMRNAGGYYVIVVEDLNSEKIIACASLVTEQKFIHNCGLRGRLEDVVVNKSYRGKQLGKLVVLSVKRLAQDLRCYKLNLDCKDNLIKFYQSLGFETEKGNANSMTTRFPQAHL